MSQGREVHLRDYATQFPLRKQNKTKRQQSYQAAAPLVIDQVITTIVNALALPMTMSMSMRYVTILR